MKGTLNKKVIAQFAKNRFQLYWLTITTPAEKFVGYSVNVAISFLGIWRVALYLLKKQKNT